MYLTIHNTFTLYACKLSHWSNCTWEPFILETRKHSYCNSIKMSLLLNVCVSAVMMCLFAFYIVYASLGQLHTIINFSEAWMEDADICDETLRPFVLQWETVISHRRLMLNNIEVITFLIGWMLVEDLPEVTNQSYLWMAIAEALIICH